MRKEEVYICSYYKLFDFHFVIVSFIAHVRSRLFGQDLQSSLSVAQSASTAMDKGNREVFSADQVRPPNR